MNSDKGNPKIDKSSIPLIVFNDDEGDDATN